MATKKKKQTKQETIVLDANSVRRSGKWLIFDEIKPAKKKAAKAGK